jgi:sulfate permease, SulP family
MPQSGPDERAVLRGDIFGGLTAAVIALPLALAFGVAAFGPLGPEHASTGALVGLLGAIFTGFFASTFGGTPSQVTGPTAPMTVVVTAFLAEAVKRHGMDQAVLVLVMMALTIVLAGVGQIAIGLTGGGKIVKYIPYPVVAGFMNGIAILIFLGQLKPFVGVQGGWHAFDAGRAFVPVVVGVITMVALLVTKKLSKTIPASLVGLLAGVGAYLALAAAGRAPMTNVDNGLLVGAIPNPFADLDKLKALLPVFHLDTLAQLGMDDLQHVLTSAGTLAVLGCIDSLLTSVVADQRSGVRHDARRELVGQGIGNIVSGSLGGLAGAGATVRTLVNLDAGGTTRRAGMLHAVVILLVVVVLGGPAGWIPKAALSGILFVTAVNMLDQYSLGLVRRSLVRYEFAIIVTVALVTVVVDLMIAVGVGVAVAGALFVWEQTRKPAIRRRLRGDAIFSRRVRRAEEDCLLKEHGAKTLAYELSGSLFFGTTDQLVSEVERDIADAERFLFDFSKVEDMDLSGVRVLVSIFNRLRDEDCVVAVSGLPDLERRSPRVRGLIEQLDVLATVTEEHRHKTLDQGLEVYEQELLDELMPSHVREIPTPLRDCTGFDELDDEERALLEERIGKVLEVADGELLAKQGEPADALCLVRGGRVSVVRSGGGDVRLTSLGPGALWGLRALLDGQHWSSSLRAEGPVHYTAIARKDLEALRGERPELVTHLERALLHSAIERLDLLAGELTLLEEA